MLVEYIMRKNIGRVRADQTVAEASIKMSDGHLAASVVEFDGKTLGVAVNRGLVRRTLSKGLNPMSTMILSMTTLGMERCRCTISVYEALEIMENKNVDSLLVTDHEHNLVGLLLHDDLTSYTPIANDSDNTDEFDAYDREIRYMVR